MMFTVLDSTVAHRTFSVGNLKVYDQFSSFDEYEDRATTVS